MTRKAVEQVIGLFTHPFMHKRILLSCFADVYIWCQECEPGKVKRLSKCVIDELISAVLMMPLAEANARWQLSSHISATDATPTSGGSARSKTSANIISNLYRVCEHRGEHVRLDWGKHDIVVPSTMKECHPELQELPFSHVWKTGDSYTFPRREHVNITELRALLKEVKFHAVQNQFSGIRVVCLCDSRVVVGCWSKGRSSSKRLNQLLRKAIVWATAGRTAVSLLWVGTDWNPGDAPSRNRPMLPPGPVPTWAKTALLSEDLTFLADQHSDYCNAFEARERVSTSKSVSRRWSHVGSVRCNDGSIAEPLPRTRANTKEQAGSSKMQAGPEGITQSSSKSLQGLSPRTAALCIHDDFPWMFQEVFAGGKQLTARMRRNKKWIVNVPIDCHSLDSYRRDMDILRDDVMEELLRKARRPRQYWHLGIPCDSFSIANVNMNAGTRSSDLPEGNGSLAREILGNELLSRGLRVIRALVDAGNYWSVENPKVVIYSSRLRLRG